MTTTTALAHTEASVHSALVLRAVVALSLTDEAFKNPRFRPINIERVAFATGLPALVIDRVTKSYEFTEDLEVLRAKLRDDPLTEMMAEEIGLLAVRGLREIRALLDDPKVSRSKKADTAFKLFGLLGYQGAGMSGMTNLISADAVNILQISGGPTPEEAAVLRQMRDRALRGEVAPQLTVIEASEAIPVV